MMRNSRLRDSALTRWLLRRPAWAYVCIVAGAGYVLMAACVAVSQWLFFAPVDLRSVLTNAVAGTVVLTVVFYRLRVNTLDERPPPGERAGRLWR